MEKLPVEREPEIKDMTGELVEAVSNKIVKEYFGRKNIRLMLDKKLDEKLDAIIEDVLGKHHKKIALEVFGELDNKE